MTVSVRQSSFAGGEFAREMLGRTDFKKYETGLGLCLNWMVDPRGALLNRPGTTKVATTKTAGVKVRLIPFTFSDTQTYVFEFGNLYVRLHQNGAPVLVPSASAWSSGPQYAVGSLVSYNGYTWVCILPAGGAGQGPGTLPAHWLQIGVAGTPLEIVTPYVTADLPRIKYCQTGDIVRLVHPNYPPQDLSRYGAYWWTLTNTVVSAAQAAKAYITDAWISTPNAFCWVPVAPKGSPFTTGGTAYIQAQRWGWAVTTIDGNGNESLPWYTNEYYIPPLGPIQDLNPASGHLFQNPIYLNVAVSGLPIGGVNIYRGRGGPSGAYGLVASLSPTELVWAASTYTFCDDGTAVPDFATSPPQGLTPFPGLNVYNNGGVIPSYANSHYYTAGDRVVGQSGQYVYECVASGWSNFSGTNIESIVGQTLYAYFKDQDSTYGPFIYASELNNVVTGQYCVSNGKIWKATAGSGYINGASAGGIAPGTWFGLPGPTGTSPYTDSTITWTYQNKTGSYAMWKYIGPIGQVLNEFPSVVTFVDDRLVFANSTEKPAHLWGSQAGNFVNFKEIHFPVVASDPYDFDLSYKTYEEIRGFIATRTLLTMTSQAEWLVQGDATGDGITPISIYARPNSFHGMAWLDPLLIEKVGVYVQSRQSKVREILFDFYTQMYSSTDMTVFSQHLFQNHQIVDWYYAKLPYSIIWAVREDGVLLGCTYIREQEVMSWHQHTTYSGGDLFENVCAISELTPQGFYEDMVYVVVNRSGTRIIERFASRQVPRSNGEYVLNQNYAIFLDSSVQYSGSGLVSFSGLSHLEGRQVMVLGDGNVYGPYTVTSGTISILADCPDGVSYATVGLPYNSDGSLLPVWLGGQQSTRSNVKNISRISFEAADARGGLWFGPDFGSLREWQQRQVLDSYGVVAPFTGLDHVRFGNGYTHDGTVVFRQTDPLPITLLAIEREVELGGD